MKNIIFMLGKEPDKESYILSELNATLNYMSLNVM